MTGAIVIDMAEEKVKKLVALQEAKGLNYFEVIPFELDDPDIACPMINKQRVWQSRLRPAISEFSRPPSGQGRRAGGTDRRDAGQRPPVES